MSFKDNDDRGSYEQYYLATVEMKYDNVMVDGRNLFDQPVKNDFETYDNIREISTGQADDYTVRCL